jgi:hypothetical protein
MNGTASMRNFVMIDGVVHRLVELGIYSDRHNVHGIEILQTSFCVFKRRIRKGYIKIVFGR